MRRILDVMVRRVTLVREDERLEQALARMAESGLRAVPVVTGFGRFAGLLFVEDVDVSATASPVLSVMRRDVPAVHPWDRLEVARRRLARSRPECVPVVAALRLLGVTRFSDIEAASGVERIDRLFD